MASLVYNDAYKRILAAYIAGKDIRARLCMTNTTCDTETDTIIELVDFTTIDVCDATGYADVALGGEAASADDTNDRGIFDANDVVFSGLGGDATRNYQGVLLYEYVDGTNTNDKALCFVDFSADVPKAATSVTVPWDAGGIIQLAMAA